jgi:hypothetical protein
VSPPWINQDGKKAMKIMNILVCALSAGMLMNDGNAQDRLCQRERPPGNDAGADKKPCPWVRVRAGATETALYAAASGSALLGSVPRSARGGGDVYLQRLATSQARLQVLVVGNTPANGTLGWVERDQVEGAPGRCSHLPSQD